MRVIRFRGKELVNRTWVYGSLYTQVRDDEEVLYIISPEKYGESNEVEPETVGQYTGFKGKNGIDVYEGDIVEAPDYYAKRGIVIQIPPIWGLYDGVDGVCDGFIEEDWEEFTVIGNRHDNPELLQVREVE